MYEPEKKYHLKSFSVAVLLLMTAYYAVALFHLPNPITLLRAGGWRWQIQIYVAAIYLGVILLGMTSKFGALFSFGARMSGPRKLLPAFLTISFYLIALGIFSLAVVLIAAHFSSLITSTYWQNSHWFWVALLVFLAYGALGLLIGRFGLFQWQALRNLKAIPVVCPVFCFGGPHFLAENLRQLGVQDSLIRTYSILMFLAGFLFLVYWLFFALIDHRYESNDESGEPHRRRRRWPVYHSRNAPLSERPIYLGFGLFGFPMYVVTVVLLDAALVLAQLSSAPRLG